MTGTIIWVIVAAIALFVAWFIGGVHGYRAGMRDGKEEGVIETLKYPDEMSEWLRAYYARIRRGK